MKSTRLNKFLLTALVGVIVLLVIAVSSFADDTNFVPKQFKTRIDSFKRPLINVELQDGVLLYSKTISTNVIQVKITPTAEQWQEFRRSLDDLKIWQWQNRYNNYEVRDGTSWSILIQYADHGLNIRGSNAYPDADGKPGKEPEPTPTFKSFLAAVQKLLGDNDFE